MAYLKIKNNQLLIPFSYFFSGNCLKKPSSVNANVWAYPHATLTTTKLLNAETRYGVNWLIVFPRPS